MINCRRHEHLIKIAVQQLIVKALCYKRSSELHFQAVLHLMLEEKPAPCSFPPLTRVQLAHSPLTRRAEMSLPFRETSPRPIGVRWPSQARILLLLLLLLKLPMWKYRALHDAGPPHWPLVQNP